MKYSEYLQKLGEDFISDCYDFDNGDIFYAFNTIKDNILNEYIILLDFSKLSYGYGEPTYVPYGSTSVMYDNGFDIDYESVDISFKKYSWDCSKEHAEFYCDFLYFPKGTTYIPTIKTISRDVLFEGFIELGIPKEDVKPFWEKLLNDMIECHIDSFVY